MQSAQPCAANTGYTKPCFHNEPIKFIIISHTDITLTFFYCYSQESQRQLSQHTSWQNFQQYGKCSFYSTFISLLIYTTIPAIFSPFSNIHPIHIIHAIIPTTSTIPTILSINPFIHRINGPMNWRIW